MLHLNFHVHCSGKKENKYQFFKRLLLRLSDAVRAPPWPRALKSYGTCSFTLRGSPPVSLKNKIGFLVGGSRQHRVRQLALWLSTTGAGAVGVDRSDKSWVVPAGPPVSGWSRLPKTPLRSKNVRDSAGRNPSLSTKKKQNVHKQKKVPVSFLQRHPSGQLSDSQRFDCVFSS